MKKYLWLLGIVLGSLFYIIHSKPHQAPSENTSSSTPFTIVTPWEITALDPSKSGYIFQRLQLAETLVDVDELGRLQPALAVNWQANSDASEWTFQLRQNVKFHDNTELTADDVVRSLTVALTKPGVLKAEMIKEIKALDKHQVQIVLQEPLAVFPVYLTHSSTLILAQNAYDAENNVVQIIGTGAYLVKQIEAPQKIMQTAFSEYWGQQAAIKNVEYLASSRSESRTLLAQSNPNSMVMNLDAASLSRLKNDPNLNIHTQSIARTIQLKVNAAHPLFTPALRQILSDAIDRQGIANAVLRMENSQADQIFPTAFDAWRIKVEDQAPDYAALKTKLAALGFSPNAQGILEKDGQPFRFTLRTFSDRPELPLIATALQNQWKQLGIDVVVAIGNFSEIPLGHQNGTLEMALYARNYGATPDPLGTLLQDFAPQGGDWGVMNWQNAQLNSALNQLQQTTDEHVQADLKQQIAHIIYQEKPIIPIVYYQQNVVTHKTLNGVKVDPFERNFYLNQLSW